MGLAPLLVDTYRKYKKGTNNFVQWLAETARATGTVNDVLKDSRQDVVPPTGGRLKGVARQQAKKAGLTHDPTITCQVTNKSFLTLATAIAADKHTCVPPAVYNMLRAVTQGRKECANWYLMASDETDDAVKESNVGHRKFIQLLEDVLEILKPKQPHTQHQPLRTARNAPLHTSNAYEHLVVEDSLYIEDMPDFIESPVKPVQEKVTYKLESSDIDVSFAIYCFLKDVTHIRLAVRRTWREFAKGDIGVQAAALTMNAALAMIEKLSNEFEQAHQRFNEFESQGMHLEIIHFIHSGYSEREKGSAFIDADDEDSDPSAYNEEKQRLSSKTVMCTHTTELLVEIFLLEKNKENCRLTNDEKRFLKCVSQLASTPDGSVIPHSYLVGKAARNLLYDQQLNGWIVFSLQVFWDMQRELASCLPVGSMLLHKTGHQLIGRYETYLDVKGLENVGVTHVTFREVIIRSKRLVEYLVDDTQVQNTFDHFEKQSGRTFDNTPGFSLLKHDPALCGLISVAIRDDYHTMAINMASNQGQIMVSAHLYNAVQQSGDLPKDLQWTDMDWLIERQGSDWMFMGERPKQGSAFGKRVNLVMGSSIHKYTTDYMSHNPDVKPERKVGGIRLEFHARRCELAVDREPRHKNPVGDNNAKDDILIMVECLVNDFQGKLDGPCKTLSSLDKLRIFKLAIENDEPAFAFDVLDLNLRCIRLLQEIQRYAIICAPLDYPVSRFTKGLTMNTVIRELLYDLEGRLRYRASMFPVAAAILCKIVQKEGNIVLTTAKMCQDEMQLSLEDSKAEDEPSFENPFEDEVDLRFRNMAAFIIVQDDKGNCRMPFDS
ncbi:hypothetical protein ACET3X_000212 [Alternaria dauci]|uniref:DUF6604 domain-containing protein n=1 Tax=Alternaria dauci TaxID=48095 RepID=A0ABR3UU96_9PLEO